MKLLTRLAQCHAPGSALQQGKIYRLFQLLYQGSEGRLGQKEALGGSGETTFFHNVKKGAYLFERYRRCFHVVAYSGFRS